MCEEIGQSPHAASWGGIVCKGFGQSAQGAFAPSWGANYMYRDWTESTSDTRGLLGWHCVCLCV